MTSSPKVQTDVGALITWAEEEARRDRDTARHLHPGYEIFTAGLASRAEKLEAIATELRKLVQPATEVSE